MPARLAVVGKVGVEVHEGGDAVRVAVGHGGGDHPAVAVPDQDNRCLGLLDERCDLVDVGVQVDQVAIGAVVGQARPA